MSPVLERVTIRASDMASSRPVFEAITGRSFQTISDGDGELVRLDDATLVLEDTHETSGVNGRDGISSTTIRVDDLDQCAQRLHAIHASFTIRDGRISIDSVWSNGVDVILHAMHHDATTDHPASAALDHLAVLVDDVEDAAERWTAILGQAPDHTGVHPLGTSVAARFIIGHRMIEIVAPRPDHPDSPLRQRHNRVGDGPLAVAIIADDLERTVVRVKASGARIINQPPHLLVHPSDAAGAMIQLTPRVHS